MYRIVPQSCICVYAHASSHYSSRLFSIIEHEFICANNHSAQFIQFNYLCILFVTVIVVAVFQLLQSGLSIAFILWTTLNEWTFLIETEGGKWAEIRHIQQIGRIQMGFFIFYFDGKEIDLENIVQVMWEAMEKYSSYSLVELIIRIIYDMLSTRQI